MSEKLPVGHLYDWHTLCCGCGGDIHQRWKIRNGKRMYRCPACAARLWARVLASRGKRLRVRCSEVTFPLT